MAPDEGLALFTELAKARQCFVLENELHLIYLVTPYNACYSWGNIDWMFYLELWEKLPVSMKRVGELVGIKESYIVNATRGKIQTNTNKLFHKFLTHKRFFVALALQDLVNEKPLPVVCAKFNCNRGMLQSLQQSASSFAGMVTSFSRQLGWASVELLISQFQDRLQFGVSRDLLDLMRLPILNGKIARILFDASIETVATLANSTVIKIENILYSDIPFESEKEQGGESEFDLKQRNKFRNVWISGKEGLTEQQAAELLVNEARKFIKLDMGLIEARWETSLIEQNQRSSESEILKTENICKEIERLQINNEDTKPDVINTKDSNCELSENFINKKCVSSNAFHINDISDTSRSGVISDVTKLSNRKTGDTQLQKSSKTDECVHDTQSAVHKETTCTSNLNSKKEVEITSKPKISRVLKSSSEIVPNDSIKLFEERNMFPSASFLEDAFSGTFDEGTNICQNSDRNMKRGISTLEGEQKTPSKKQKTGTDCNNVLDNDRGVLHCTKKLFINQEHNDFNSIEIVDVCSNSSLFDSFTQELEKQNSIALSLACMQQNDKQQMIGIKQNDQEIVEKNYENPSKNGMQLNGLSISWGSNISFYLTLKSTDYQIKVINIIKNLISNDKLLIKIFNSKEQLKALKDILEVHFQAGIDDPKIGDWIMNPDEKEKNLLAMVSFDI